MKTSDEIFYWYLRRTVAKLATIAVEQYPADMEIFLRLDAAVGLLTDAAEKLAERESDHA